MLVRVKIPCVVNRKDFGTGMQREKQKILVVADTTLPHRTGLYAINVAVRLDLEIIVLFIVEEGVLFDDCKEKQTKFEEIKKEIQREMVDFSTRAWKSGIKVTVVVNMHDREQAITDIQMREPEIRFVLSATENDRQDVEADIHHPRLTVIRRD